MTMADPLMPMEDDLSYYEEEVSVYDTGLSTIHEVDNESDGSVGSISTKEVKSQTRSSFTEPASLPPLPPNGTTKLVTPKPYANNTNNSLSRKFLESPGFDLVSPPIMTQKIQFSNLSPLTRLPSLVGNSPLDSSIPSPAKRPNNLPLSMTHHITGEDVVIYDDDDEYTFVSCSDTDSFFGDVALDNLDSSYRRNSDLMDQSIGSIGRTSYGNLDISVRSSDMSLRSSMRSSSGSIGSVGSSSGVLDFATKKTRLEEALERRGHRQKGNLAVETDGFRRKLRYELTRKMFKEQLQRCRSKPPRHHHLQHPHQQQHQQQQSLPLPPPPPMSASMSV